MGIGFRERHQLTKAFNEALKSGDIQKAAEIDAKFREAIADEKPKDRASKNAAFRKEAKDKYIRSYRLCLTHQFMSAHLHNQPERAAEIRQDFLGTFYASESEIVQALQREEKKEFENAISTVGFFDEKLVFIHKKYEEDKSKASEFIDALQQLDVAITQKIGELRAVIELPDTEEKAKSRLCNEIAVLEQVREKVQKRIELYSKPQPAIAKNEPKDKEDAGVSVVQRPEDEYEDVPLDVEPVQQSQPEASASLTHNERLLISGLVDAYYAAMSEKHQNPKEVSEKHQKLEDFLGFNPRRSGDSPAREAARRQYAEKLLNLSLTQSLSKLPGRKPEPLVIVPAVSATKKSTRNPLKIIYRLFNPKQDFENPLDKYIFYMENSFGKVFHQTRFLTAAYRFLKMMDVREGNDSNQLDALDKSRRNVIEKLFMRPEFKSLIESSKHSGDAHFKKLGENLTLFERAFFQKFAHVVPQEDFKPSRTRIRYRNAFAIKRLSKYVERQEHKVVVRAR